jgi:hypothetical protein
MGLLLEADDHGGELIVREDKSVLTIVVVDEDLSGLEVMSKDMVRSTEQVGAHVSWAPASWKPCWQYR